MSRFGSYKLRVETIKNLQILKRAYEMSYQKDFTNDKVIEGLISGLKDSDCNVFEIYGKMKEDEAKYESLVMKRKNDLE